MNEKKEQKRDLQERTFEFARRAVRLCSVLDAIPGVRRKMEIRKIRDN